MSRSPDATHTRCREASGSPPWIVSAHDIAVMLTTQRALRRRRPQPDRGHLIRRQARIWVQVPRILSAATRCMHRASKASSRPYTTGQVFPPLLAIDLAPLPFELHRHCRKALALVLPRRPLQVHKCAQPASCPPQQCRLVGVVLRLCQARQIAGPPAVSADFVKQRGNACQMPADNCLMEPTGLNANHSARLPGGRMSLDEED